MISEESQQKMKVIKLMMEFADVQIKCQPKSSIGKEELSFINNYSLVDLYECREISSKIAKKAGYETDAVTENIVQMIDLKKLMLIDRVDDVLMAISHATASNHNCKEDHDDLETDIEKLRLYKHEIVDLVTLLNEAFGYTECQA